MEVDLRHIGASSPSNHLFRDAVPEVNFLTGWAGCDAEQRKEFREKRNVTHQNGTIEDVAMATDTRQSGYANAAEFDQPHWKVIAAGFDTEKWFTEGQAQGTGGILMPVPTRMPSGNYYYRFASSTSARPAQLGGGWWIDFEAFRTIETFAKTNGYRLKDAARLTLALPYDWTKVDLLIRALLKSPLRAYTGIGKPAQGGLGGADKGTKWIPTQHIKVRQLYVPGLFVRGRSKQLYETVFLQPPESISLR